MRPFLIATVAALSLAASAADQPAPRTLRLEDAVRLSAAAAPVDIARLDAAIARANLGAQRVALLPQLDATGGWVRGRSYLPLNNEPFATSPDNVVDARLRLGQALIDLDALHRSRAAGARVSAANALATQALEDSAATAAAAYVDLVRAHALGDVRRGDLKLAQELAALAKAQVDAGAVEGIALTRASTRVAEAQTALAVAAGAEHGAAITLAAALALDPGTPLIAGDTLGDALGASRAAETVAQALIDAAGQRPELLAAVANVAAAEEDCRAAGGARLPRVDGFADGGRIGPSADDTVTTWRVGVQVTVPLLDRRPWDQQAASLTAARERIRLDDLRRQIAAQVHGALVGLETGRAALISAADGKRLAEREVNEARARFTAGAASNLELIDAQRSLARAGEALVAAQDGVAQARVRLARAVGVAVSLH